MADRSDLLACSFCGKNQKQVRKLIAGPGAYICDKCTDLADQVIVTGVPAATALSPVVPVGAESAATQCSFCGKRRSQVSGLAAAGQPSICDECLSLCHEILTEELA